MASKKIINSSQSLTYVLIIIGFIAVVNYLGTRWFFRIDLTEGREYSISPATKNMLRRLDDIINIKVYFSRNLPPHLKMLESGIRDLLTEFKAFSGGNLRITWEDPADSENLKQQVRGMGIPEIQLQTFERDKAQAMNAFLGIAVLYADKKEILPVVQELRNLEYDIAQAVMKVSRQETPKIGILKTDSLPKMPPQVMARMNMQDLTEEKYRPMFENLRQNYDVETVDLSEGQPIDASIRTLIIPGGNDRAFTERHLFEIDQHFMNGGNLIALVDAVGISFEQGVNARVQEPKIIHLLEHYGVRVEKQIVLDASCGQVQVPQRMGMFTMNVAVNYPYFVRIGEGGFDKTNPAVSGLGEMIMPWVSPVTLLVNQTGQEAMDAPEQVEATVLVRSSNRSWTDTGPAFVLNPQQDWNQRMQSAAEDVYPKNLAVYLHGDFASYYSGKSVPPVKSTEDDDAYDALSQINLSPADADRTITEYNTGRHLVVVGDSDFLSAQNAAPGNIAFILNIVDWLTLDENLIGIRSRSLVDRTIQSDRLDRGSPLPNIIRWINILTMPLILIITGLALFLKRRERITETVPAKDIQSASNVSAVSEKKEDNR